MPTDTRDDLALAADQLRVLAARHADEADATRRLAPEVVAALRGAGFARHFVAGRFGGREGSFRDLTRAVATVGEGCASTAWCASLIAYSARFASLLPEDGHRALWGGNPDAIIATALMPAGRAVRESGGWRLSGQWAYVSGIDFADWVLLCSPVVGESNGGPPPARFFALPTGSYTVRETWDSIGMRATGSHTVVVDDQLVPDHLSYPRTEMVSGRNATSAVPAHNVPFQAVGGLTFIAPVLGAAAGALQACVAALTGKRRTPSLELGLIRASAMIDAARFLIDQNGEVIDERRFTPDEMARNERNATYSAEILVEAVGVLIACAGSSGLAEALPLQRFWRDVVSASSHIALKYDTAARRNYSAVLLGPEA